MTGEGDEFHSCSNTPVSWRTCWNLQEHLQLMPAEHLSERCTFGGGGQKQNNSSSSNCTCVPPSLHSCMQHLPKITGPRGDEMETGKSHLWRQVHASALGRRSSSQVESVCANLRVEVQGKARVLLLQVCFSHRALVSHQPRSR